MTQAGNVQSSADLVRVQRISGTQFRKGVTAPTDETVGTTPTVPVLRFGNVNELVTVVVPIPPNYQPGTDIEVVVLWSLVNAQLNLDTLDVTCDYVAATLAGGGGLAKTSTQITGQVTAVTGRLAAGDLYEMTLTFAAADATNPLASAIELALEIHLTNVTGVAEADLVSGFVQFDANY